MKNFLKNKKVTEMVDEANKSLDKVSGLWKNAKSQINNKLKKKDSDTEK